MQKQAQLEQLLRSALAEKAGEIDASSGMWQNVKTGITKEERIFMPVKNLTWSKALAGAICTLFLTLGLTLWFSPQAQVWAKDIVKSITRIFEVVKTENGYKVVAANRDDKSNSDKKIMLMIGAPSPGSGETLRIPLKFLSKDHTRQIEISSKPNPKSSTKYNSAVEAETKTGFPVHLPGYLPEGYVFDFITVEPFVKSASTDKNKKSIAYAQYIASDKKILSLLITNETRLTVEGGQELSNIQISGNKLRWAEFPIIAISHDNREPETLTGHSLHWVNNGIVYVLSDESGELSQEEMVKTAESIK